MKIVVDDLGFDDLGFRNNNQIRTPHFNHLAAEGAFKRGLPRARLLAYPHPNPHPDRGRFHATFVRCPLVPPSFFSLLTGRHTRDVHARCGRVGIVLSQYYVQPSCSPTRATIMTGRKPVHTGINFWMPNQAYGLALNESTFAQVGGCHMPLS